MRRSPALRADREELTGGQGDGVGFGPDQPVTGHKVVADQARLDVVGEPVRPATTPGPSERDKVSSRRRGQSGRGLPTLEQPQERGRTHVGAGDRECCRERRDQIGTQPVQQAPLVTRGAFVVAADRSQFGCLLAVRDQHPELFETVQRDPTGDLGVFGVVFLLGPATPSGDQIRVDRDHREPGIEEPLDEHPVTGLQHHPHLGRVRFQRRR